MATRTGERYDIGGDVLFVGVHHLPELDQDDDVIPQLRALLRWVDDGTTGQSTKLENYSITVAYQVLFTDQTIIVVTQNTHYKDDSVTSLYNETTGSQSQTWCLHQAHIDTDRKIHTHLHTYI